MKAAIAKALLSFAAEGLKEGAKAFFQWAREKIKGTGKARAPAPAGDH